MTTPRIQSVLDALIAIAQRLFGLLGNTVVRHKAEQTLSLMYQEGYIPVARSELESWKIQLKAYESAWKEGTTPSDVTTLTLTRGSIENLLTEWRNFHERLPSGGSNRTSAFSRDKRQR